MITELQKCNVIGDQAAVGLGATAAKALHRQGDRGMSAAVESRQLTAIQNQVRLQKGRTPEPERESHTFGWGGFG